MSLEQVNRFLDAFTHWAGAQADIQALALVGSYARGAARPDSDIDLVVLARQPDRYLEDTAWAQRFGVIEKQQVEYYGKVTSLRVWYAGLCEVEFGFTDETWAALPLDEGTQQVMADGMRVLFERQPLLSIALAEIDP